MTYDIKVYKIYSKSNPEDYIIESTRQTLKQRMGMYGGLYLKYSLFGKLGKKYKNKHEVFDLFNEYGFNNCDIESFW